MSMTYKWNHVRGPQLTVNMVIGAANLAESWEPLTLTSNLAVVPTTGCELLGVCPSKAVANETNIPIIVSNDVYEVQVASGVNLAIGDPVSLVDDGSVTSLGGSYCVGYVVDYDPTTGGIAHIISRPSVLSLSGTNDASNKMPLSGGTFSGNVTMGSNISFVLSTGTGTKLGTSATQKLGFWGATAVVQPVHSADATHALKGDYTTLDLDTEAEIIAAINTTNAAINANAVLYNALLAKLETIGVLASA